MRVFKILMLLAITGRAFAQEDLQFPDGCGNPFVADGVFGEFYEKTIQASVVDAGAVNSSHINLFAVNRLRKHLAAHYPNPSDGDAIDKHIRAQLCEFSKQKTGIKSSSVELQRFLAGISSKLLADVKKLTADLNSREREKQKAIERYQSRYGLVEKAEELGEKEVSGLLR